MISLLTKICQSHINFLPSKQLSSYKHYTYHMAQPSHKEEILQLIVNARKAMSPLMLAYSKINPMCDVANHQHFYWARYMDKFVTQGLSVVCCDSENHHEIVANVCVMDFATAYTQESLSACEWEYYLKAENEICDRLAKKQPKEIIELQKIPGLVVERCAGSSKPSLNERGLFKKTIPLAMELAKKAGFKYVVSMCLNSRPRVISESLGMKVIAEIDAKEFEF